MTLIIILIIYENFYSTTQTEKKQNMKWFLHIFINITYIKTYTCLEENGLEKIHKMSFLTCENSLLWADTTF